MRVGAAIALIAVLWAGAASAQTRRPVRSPVDGAYSETVPPADAPDAVDLLQQQTEALYQQRSHDDRRPSRSHR